MVERTMQALRAPSALSVFPSCPPCPHSLPSPAPPAPSILPPRPTCDMRRTRSHRSESTRSPRRAVSAPRVTAIPVTPPRRRGGRDSGHRDSLPLTKPGCTAAVVPTTAARPPLLLFPHPCMSAHAAKGPAPPAVDPPRSTTVRRHPPFPVSRRRTGTSRPPARCGGQEQTPRLPPPPPPPARLPPLTTSPAQ